MVYKKPIEVVLTVPKINDVSVYGKIPGIGQQPKDIRHWQARLPLPAAWMVLFASVVDDDPFLHPDKFPTDET